jgi:hypothetical protein
MFLGILVLLTGLTISAVAIYYSVAGLVAIFAAAAIPIIIMGSTLEIAKLVTAVWLHRYWNRAAWWLKTYLSISVLVLMFITSMGIFGFLSKAHIDQTSSATEGLARIEQLDTQIKRQENVIAEAELAVEQVETADTNRDSEIQLQIDKEQDRIDSAYARIQPAIDEQNVIVAKEEERLGGALGLYREQLTEIDNNLANIEQFIESNNITALQAQVGVKADGNLGPATRNAIEAYRTAQSVEKQRLGQLIAQESSNVTSPVIDAARAEVQRLRSLAEQEIANSNELINRLRQQLGKTDADQIATEVEKQNAIIERAEQEIATLSEQKFGLESEYRKLEAEVGPIKYLAEFVYGTSDDKDLLEEAVRWVIVLIIFVFDPLAVLLLIASQYTFEFHKENKNRVRKEQERKDYEQARAQRIVNNPGYQPGGQPEETKNEVTTGSNNEQPDKTSTPTEDSGTDTSERDSGTDTVQTDKAGSSWWDAGTEDMGRLDSGSIVNSSQQDRADKLEELEKTESFKNAKQRWKEENPEATIKEYKDAYITGKIDELPWTEYIQNSEQGNDSIWQRIRKKLDE